MGIPPEILEQIRNGGAISGVVFAWLWWLERTDRKATQKKLDTLGERGFTVIESVKATLDAFRALLGGRIGQ